MKKPRALAFRYVGALLVVAALLVAGQAAVQVALDRQQGDSRTINIAGRQRMLSQRLRMQVLAGERADTVADEWEKSQRALQQADNSDDVRALFASIEGDHQAMLAAARAGAPVPREREEAFLAGMDRIVAQFEREARERVVELRRTELALLVLVLAVLAFEGVFVFRPAVRGLRAYLAERDEAQQALLAVSDREQQRLAQDLHDGLSQHLVGVSYLVKSLPADARVDEIGKLLAESIEQTRGLARGLYSATLEVEGLPAALRELAAHTERVFGVECRVTADPVELAMPLRGHLYRIAREAVLNAAKHAKASAIEIALARTGDAITLTVRDDGVGAAPRPGDGMGLHLMEARAKMIGGSLTIAVDRGTTVSCTVPQATA